MRVLVFKPKEGKRDVLFRPAPSKGLSPVVVRGVADGEVTGTVTATLDEYKAAEQAARVAAAS